MDFRTALGMAKEMAYEEDFNTQIGRISGQGWQVCMRDDESRCAEMDDPVFEVCAYGLVGFKNSADPISDAEFIVKTFDDRD